MSNEPEPATAECKIASLSDLVPDKWKFILKCRCLCSARDDKDECVKLCAEPVGPSVKSGNRCDMRTIEFSLGNFEGRNLTD